MRRVIIFLFLINTCFTMDAQTYKAVAGEYGLRGVMEVGSGFKLNEDSSFQFFFSYGALDRWGEGTWVLKDGNMVLNSKTTWPGKDFALTESRKSVGDQTLIRIIDSNTIFRSAVFGILFSGGKKFEQYSDKQGLMLFPAASADSIQLYFEFSPERSSTIIPPDPSHNEFSFRIEPSVMEVFFSHFVLKVTPEGLEGHHPLLAPKSYRYSKH